MPQQLLFLELNEINFEYVASYVRRGGLPNLGRLIRVNGVARTVSEQRYEELEPWIQWVTAHTGMPLARTACSGSATSSRETFRRSGNSWRAEGSRSAQSAR